MGCSLLLRQLLLLLWKNFILQIRRPIGTVFELLIPALALAVVVGIRQIPGVGIIHTCFATFQSDYLQVPKPYGELYYSPSNTNTTMIMELAVKRWSQLNSTGNLIAVATQEEMVDILMNITDSSSLCSFGAAGVYFDSVDSTNIQYTLRFPYEQGWDTNDVAQSFVIDAANTESSYMTNGFINIQRVIEESIVKFLTNSESPDIDLSMRQFPYPPTAKDPFLELLGFSLSLLLMLAFMYTFSQIVKELVLEKETRIRESMLMMGLQQWVLWTTWFLKQLIFMLIWVLAFPILLKFTKVWPNSDFFLLLIFFLLYVMSIIAFGFLVSVWFNSPLVSLICSLILFFVSFVPNFFIPFFYDKIPYGGKLALSLLSNTAFGLGVTVISNFEERQLGLQWTNAAEPLSIEDPLNMGAIYGMLICDIVLYMLIAWYVDAVKPGQYGVPKPLYFPFLPSYWTGKPRQTSPEEVEASGWHDPGGHEEEPRDLEAGIRIHNLIKIYDQWGCTKRGKKLAVDDLNLNMYEGQITALLGHNGAGKTTTISILTGLYTPTAGTAVINGYDIRNNMDQIRQSLGICPQHNVLLERLTVREHLRLFAMLKGMPGAKVKEEVNSMLEDLQLSDKTNITAGNLSGGMKRKLSVGIALIGGSKIVVLDEPTSGMDPYARRATWDLLIKHKEGRTMLLTTHFMDEADLLGDRIAIMADGRLMCSGSSLFLKRRYGVGYHLTLVKGPSCDSREMSELVTSTVPGSQLATDVGAELTFLLPFTSSQYFPVLLESLEEKRDRLGFSSFGLSLTTMEEVFMKVGTGSTETADSRLKSLSVGATPASSAGNPPAMADSKINEKPPTPESDTTHVITEEGVSQSVTTPLTIVEEGEDFEAEGVGYHQLPGTRRHTGMVLWFQQFCAMYLKRCYNSLRFYIAVITQLLLPMIFILLALILIKIPVPNIGDEPRRLLTLHNSALSRNVTAFWAEFGDQSPNFSFANVSADSISASNFFDYTARVQAIRERVKNHTNISSCCDYEYQLLDKFCASRKTEDYEGSCKGQKFSYLECQDCLGSCYTPSRTAALSCSSQPYDAELGDYCPAPPVLSVDDYYDNDAVGPLDSDNTFIAEYLVKVADDLKPSVFFQQVQAGFVVSYQEPALSFCGLANKSRNEEIARLLVLFYSNSTPQCETKLNDCQNDLHDPFIGYSQRCIEALNCVSEVEPNITLPGDYYDGLRSGLQSGLQELVCTGDPALGTVDSVAQISPVQEDTLTVTIWYNNQPYHMVAAALNAFHNILLKQGLGEEWSISAYNHPLPRTEETKENQTLFAAFYGLGFSILASFGFAFLISSFAVFPVQERECKAKHLQFVSGVNAIAYWLANYAWDLLNAVVIVIIVFIFIVAFQTDGYTGQGLGAVLVLMLSVCWAGIPIAYCVSFLFKSHLLAYGVLFLIFFFPPLAFQLVVMLVSDSNTKNILNYLFLLHPGYGMQIGFGNIYISQTFSEVCKNGEIPRSACNAFYVEDIYQFDRPGIGSAIMYNGIEGVLLLFLVIAFEYSFFIPYVRQWILYHQEQNGREFEPQTTYQLLEDDDVHHEKVKVLGGQSAAGDDVVVIKNLTKVYSPHVSGCSIAPANTAVKEICLAIPRGEFFGFVGVNGAGKTSTFSMLTGDISPTRGTAVISGYDIRTDLRKVQQNIGYCPQFDALIERMTGRELLTMFARLRGIPERNIKAVVTSTIQKLDLSKYANKQYGKYSGGNKRKLSTAIALIGDPPILFLDEPTTGMDPATRRYLWDVLTGVTREGRSIVLTTHSMEECEALCTRLAIMVNGEFKCLGSIQHLKSKFGAGYTLQAKVGQLSEAANTPQVTPQSSAGSLLSSLPGPKSDDDRNPPLLQQQNMSAFPMTVDTTALKRFIEQSFDSARLKEEHQGSVTYQLPTAGLTWASIFHQLEANKERLGIIDYSVSQTTLDQVFISFAKLQEGVVE